MNPTASPTVPSGAQSTLYQELVVEHKRAPRHFGKLAAPTHEARGHNPQCGDDLKVQLRIEGDRIGDIRFDGHGCAICIASASMMTEAVIGRDIEAARELQQRFRAVLTGQAGHDEAYLGKLASLAAVQRYPSRIKCALLGWHALAHALDTRVAAPSDAEPSAS
ncbi:SUF system NifU family Fe-S cluster assembly protein [Burkholderia thailandensis]|uniref:SUF system FeS assembly protein, NifU family n=1 Tax=Burkholderia thailandensis TaxID=57975 RepID=A0AAW9D3G4_BURTH|nr:SUF system NifU family Fe-S cluster assembly protein [Burkholderia thailandensis]MCS3395081.1 SUF system NifU family Fe-S cluster assembly protein [Burkholderia thailandensis]MCS6428631.1 SUF system NifU family Fe-S cluster assembly protein [Burkholderia thailandensis]MCS6451392.1 SUF system NifU family Fe-S cluster assembly protein [Burkholderia thailandensis]MCS6462913.1 SUF system NifU family Fe-S cluster assembly protein [Burkholderia thailandensis]MCS6480712.1 SUF system NifU family Fe